MSISGLESVKKGDFVKIGQDRAWVYALFKDHVLAAVLSDRSVNYEGPAEIDQDFQLQVPTDRIHEGQPLTAFMPNAKGQSFQSFLRSKPPYHHLKSIKQLLTGYHQVDVCQPISLGQTVLFYGNHTQTTIYRQKFILVQTLLLYEPTICRKYIGFDENPI